MFLFTFGGFSGYHGRDGGQTVTPAGRGPGVINSRAGQQAQARPPGDTTVRFTTSPRWTRLGGAVDQAETHLSDQ